MRYFPMEAAKKQYSNPGQSYAPKSNRGEIPDIIAITPKPLHFTKRITGGLDGRRSGFRVFSLNWVWFDRRNDNIKIAFGLPIRRP